MTGVLAATTVTGRALLVGVGGSDPYGYNNGVFGTLSPTTYVDNGGNTRTVTVLAHASSSGFATLILSGVVTNNDTAFVALIINGVLFLRSAASYSNPGGTASRWDWTASNPFGTSGTKVVLVQ